mmetsp:Transcript_3870/g.13398  ORF Transcript_3870/g.13398 Transcript_3870/m.13398 type:complete len:1187 (-) Transcript_3870:47-3607(-)
MSEVYSTAALYDSAGTKCSCPSGCGACTYRSAKTFSTHDTKLGTKNAQTDLIGDFDSSNYFLPKVYINGASSYMTDGSTTLTGCPSSAELVCLSCDNDSYEHLSYLAGSFSRTSDGLELDGTGLFCLGISGRLLTDAGLSFKELGWLTMYLIILFVVLFALFNALRKIRYLRFSFDPCLYMEKNNPHYPPYARPDFHLKGTFGWLRRAWWVKDTELYNFITIDELMLLRWFRLAYTWFWGLVLFAMWPLMIAYKFEGDYQVEKDNIPGAGLHELGIKRLSLTMAYRGNILLIVVVEIWLASLWLVYLLGKETRAYARLVWKSSPKTTGIKAHAVLVSDIPVLTTDPYEDDAPGGTGGNGLMMAINKALQDELSDSKEVVKREKSIQDMDVVDSPLGQVVRAATAKKRVEEAGEDAEATPKMLPRASLRAEGSSIRTEPSRNHASSMLDDGYSQSPPSSPRAGKGLTKDEVEAEEAKKFMRRHKSELKEFVARQGLDDYSTLRACTRKEIATAVKKKLELILGEDAVVSITIARDTRKLDKAAEAYNNLNIRHFQQLVLENNLKLHLSELDQKLMKESETMSAEELARTQKAHNDLVIKIEKSDVQREKTRNKLRDKFLAFDQGRQDYLNDESPSPSAIVVFSRQMDSVIASSMALDDWYGRWKTSAAPGPNDLVWHNVSLTSKQRFWKNMRAHAIAAVVILFFMIPINYITYLISLGYDDIVAAIGTSGHSILIALVLTIFLVVGHIVSLVLSKQYGYTSKAKMDSRGADIYFWLLFCNLFLTNVSGSSVLYEDLRVWLNRPATMVNALMVQIVSQQTFFLLFCMLRIAQSCPLELLHPPFHLGFIVKSFLFKVRSQSRPALKMIQTWTQPENTPMHRVPAQTMFVFFLGTMYCMVQPLVIPVCAVFFSLFYLFFKHNLRYHYMQSYNFGQTTWPWLVQYTFNSLMLAQIIIAIGISTLIDDGDWGERLRYLLLPLPVVTWAYHRRTKVIMRASRKVPVTRSGKKSVPDDDSDSDKFSDDEQEEIDEQGVVSNIIGNVALVFHKTFSPRKSGKSTPGSSRRPSDGNLNDLNFRTQNDLNNISKSKSYTRKHVKLLDESRLVAKEKVMKLIRKGIWRDYLPINMWPLMAESSAASVIVKRWRETNARRKATRMLSQGLASPSQRELRTPSSRSLSTKSVKFTVADDD